MVDFTLTHQWGHATLGIAVDLTEQPPKLALHHLTLEILLVDATLSL